jgi:hypothetical protein
LHCLRFISHGYGFDQFAEAPLQNAEAQTEAARLECRKTAES